MNKNYQILETETLLDDFLTVRAYKLNHDLFAGGSSPVLRRLRLEKEKAVSVLLYDPLNQKVVMVEQFRIGAKENNDSWLLENPAGYLEPGETAEEYISLTFALRSFPAPKSLIARMLSSLLSFFLKSKISSKM